MPGRMVDVVQAVAQPVGDDRPDLRLGTGQPRRRGHALAPGRPVPIERGEQLRHARPRSPPS